MPLIFIENINNNYLWGLWKMEESSVDLAIELGNCPKPEGFDTFIEKRKKEWLASRLLIKKITEYEGHPFMGTCYNPEGCPQLLNSTYNLSISHSHDYACAIIHKHKKVGIDIELIREKVKNVADKFLSEQEIEDCKGDLKKLSAYWSAKETIFKLYSGYNLNFKEQIFIRPVEFYKDGETIAEVNLDQTVEIPLKILKYKEYIITYNY